MVESKKKLVTLKEKPYDGEELPKFSFFSTYEPDQIFGRLREKL